MSSNTPWAIELYEYDSNNNLTRLGKHKTPNAKSSDHGWYIWVFTYDSSNNLTQKDGPTIGIWA